VRGSVIDAPLFAPVIKGRRAAMFAGGSPVEAIDHKTIVLIAEISAIRVASRAFLIYPVYAERPAVARIAMIAITTINSISVNPDCFFIEKSKK
jgi:hypothetical protein